MQPSRCWLFLVWVSEEAVGAGTLGPKLDLKCRVWSEELSIAAGALELGQPCFRDSHGAEVWAT